METIGTCQMCGGEIRGTVLTDEQRREEGVAKYDGREWVIRDGEVFCRGCYDEQEEG